MKIKSSIVSVASWTVLSFWIANACFGGIFMKEIKLTQGYVALVDDADFDLLNRWKWQVSVSSRPNYDRICVYRAHYAAQAKRKNIYMHRQILGVTDSKIHVDHIDHDCLNNQRSNLRSCTNSQNLMNTRKRKNGTSKYKGVSWFKRDSNWRAQITIRGKNTSIGYYSNQETAALAYNEAARLHFGEFACLNVIEPVGLTKGRTKSKTAFSKKVAQKSRNSLTGKRRLSLLIS